MRSSLRRRVTFLVLIALLAQVLPPATPLFAQSDDPIAIPLEEPLPEPPAPEPAPLPDETPATYPALPGLAVDVILATPQVVVGIPLTVTIQVANRAPHPADEVVLSLPRPAEVTPADPGDPALTADGWRWPLGQLPGESTRTITVALTLTSAPADDALVLEPQVTAVGLSEPIRAVGGGIVDPWSAEPTAAQVPVTTPLASTSTSLTASDEAALAGSQLAAEPLTPEAPLDQSTDTFQASASVSRDSLTSAQPAVAPAQRRGPRLRETRFVPGAPAVLRGPRGRVTVEFPGNGFGRPLRLVTRPRDVVEPELRAAGQPIPPLHPNQRHGFGAFFLDALEPQGAAVHRFNAPLTIRVQYTDAQLRVLGLNPGQLTLFWFNPELEVSRSDGAVRRGAWVPIPTTVDADARTATAQVDHFSAFQLGNGLSASAAFIPSLQGWQVDTFTGGASYSYPMDVPAGPGGLKPNVALSYASNADDGPGGSAKKAQASWVGRGWSLDPGGAIARNKNSCCSNWDHFTLTAMGRTFDIVRGNHIHGPASDPWGNVWDFSQWNWHIVNESYWKIRANSNNTWTAWSPEGVGSSHLILHQHHV